MDFPPVPFQANIVGDAEAYNPTGTIDWGKIPSTTDFRNNITVSKWVNGKLYVTSPTWMNGKDWTVDSQYVEPITVTPPETKAYLTLYETDGTIRTFDEV